MMSSTMVHRDRNFLVPVVQLKECIILLLFLFQSTHEVTGNTNTAQLPPITHSTLQTPKHSTSLTQTSTKSPAQSSTESPQPTHCPKDWVFYSQGDLCFFLSTDRKSWGSASDFCQAQGGQLMEIKDVYTHIFVDRLMNQKTGSYWIGLNRRTTEGIFHWGVEPETAAYTWWEDGRPSIWDNGDCVYILPSNKRMWQVGPCDTGRLYACQRPSSAVPDQGSVSPTASKLCPVGWSHLVEAKSCFFVSEIQTSYDEAESMCSASGGHLAVISSTDKHIFVNDLLTGRNGSFWIGLQMKTGEDVFRWAHDGSESSYFWWGCDQPNEKGDENCVAIDFATHLQWKDESCSLRKRYICQSGDYDEGTVIDISATTSDEPCPNGWHHDIHGHACYTTSTNRATWNTAQETCQLSGGNLVTIKDASSNIFINDVLARQEHNYWIGLHKQNGDTDFYWLDETTQATYLWWGEGEPNNEGDDNCAYVNPGPYFEWSSSACQTSLHFLCHRPEFASYISYNISTDVTCPDGWDFYKEAEMCFYLSSEKANWNSARTKCQDDGGDLAVIQDLNTHMFFTDLVAQKPKEYWLGLHDQGTDGQFTWIDSTSKEAYVYWRRDEPVNTNSDDCAFVYPHDTYRWKSSACNKDMDYACQKPAMGIPKTTQIPLSCPEEWTLYEAGEMCFYVSSKSENWHAARATCQHELNGDLATIPDEGTNEFVIDLLSTSYGNFWFGLHDHTEENVFQWLDDPTPPSFVYWSPGQPNELGPQDCGYIELLQSRTWGDTSCGFSTQYLCQQPASRGNATNTTSTVTTKCPKGWHYYQRLEKCYNASQTAANWYSARAHCQLAGGDLTVIKDEETGTFVQGVLNIYGGSYWIGLHDAYNEGTFHWLDETEPVGYTYWASGEPSNVGNENCVLAKTSFKHWDDVPCEEITYYTCEMAVSNITSLITTAAPVPDTCPTGWHMDQQGNTCFGFLDTEVTWYAARIYCQYYGGDLATIRNPETQAFISNLMEGKRDSYWIGLHDLYVDGAFHWLDDIIKTDYFEWAPNQPDNKDNQDCVLIKYSDSLTWSDEACHNTSRVLCQRSPYREGIVPSTQPTIPTPKPSEPCLPGWTFYESGRTCYLTSTIEDTWSMARVHCGQLGGDLAVVKNWMENIHINAAVSQAKADYWIGLHDTNGNGHFFWLDESEETSYTYWASNEPGYYWEGNYCVFVSGGFDWYDSDCESRRLFICEREAAEVLPVSTPTPVTTIGSCPEGWTYYAERQICFGLFHDKLPWLEARTECQKYNNGDLIVINDTETHIFVNEMLNSNIDQYWIGLHDMAVENEFVWVGDDKATDYLIWFLPGEPNDLEEREDCIHIDDTWPFRWVDNACGTRMSFSCQASPTSPTTTATKSSTSTQEPMSTTSGESVVKPGNASEEINSGVAVGIAVAVVVVVAVVVAAALFFMRRRKRNIKSPADGFDNVTYDNTSAIHLNFAGKA